MRYLYENEAPVRMRDLAEQVAAWENDTTVRELTSTQRQRVYIPLYQTHLPKLDEAGVIDYEQSRGIVEPTPLAEELYPYIEGIDLGEDDADRGPVDEPDRKWDSYYTGASGLGIGLLAGSFLGLPIVSTLSGMFIGVIVSLMFGLLTLARIVENTLTRPVN